MPIVARSQYDERPKLASDLDFKGDPGLTKQSDAKDCDINVLFKRFEKTGQLPDMIVRDGHYGDFTDVPTLQEAIELSRLANEQFMALNADLRTRFEGDPVKFYEFCNDPKNVDEMEKLGLLKPEVVKARQEARIKAAEEANKGSEDKRKAEEEALFQRFKARLQP